MASDPTAGGAPAEMPVESSDPNLDIPPKPEGVAAEVEQLQAEKADLQDKLLRALAEAQNVRRRAQQDVERELQSVLERHGIKRVESLGRPFNAEFHQAMMEVEDPTVPAGTVVQELAPGYLIAGRLLRAAMVAVSKGGPAVRSPSNEN